MKIAGCLMLKMDTGKEDTLWVKKYPASHKLVSLYSASNPLNDNLVTLEIVG